MTRHRVLKKSIYEFNILENLFIIWFLRINLQIIFLTLNFYIQSIDLNLNGLYIQIFSWKVFFSLLAIFFVQLSLENSQYQKENRMRSLEHPNPCSFWLGPISQIILLTNIFLQPYFCYFWKFSKVVFWRLSAGIQYLKG